MFALLGHSKLRTAVRTVEALDREGWDIDPKHPEECGNHYQRQRWGEVLNHVLSILTCLVDEGNYDEMPEWRDVQIELANQASKAILALLVATA